MAADLNKTEDNISSCETLGIKSCFFSSIRQYFGFNTIDTIAKYHHVWKFYMVSALWATILRKRTTAGWAG